jgi:hypothetical protein
MEKKSKAIGPNLAGPLGHSSAWPSLWPRHSGARGPLAELFHDLCGLPTGTTCGARARNEVVTALRVPVAAWLAAALPRLRWGEVEHSSIKGGGATRRTRG